VPLRAASHLDHRRPLIRGPKREKAVPAGHGRIRNTIAGAVVVVEKRAIKAFDLSNGSYTITVRGTLSPATPCRSGGLEGSRGPLADLLRRKVPLAGGDFAGTMGSREPLTGWIASGGFDVATP
jgi:hypothetical protein